MDLKSRLANKVIFVRIKELFWLYGVFDEKVTSYIKFEYDIFHYYKRQWDETAYIELQLQDKLKLIKNEAVSGFQIIDDVNNSKNYEFGSGLIISDPRVENSYCPVSINEIKKMIARDKLKIEDGKFTDDLVWKYSDDKKMYLTRP